MYTKESHRGYNTEDNRMPLDLVWVRKKCSNTSARDIPRLCHTAARPTENLLNRWIATALRF